MADLPAELAYGKVVARLILAVADTTDAGRLPNAQPAVGTVTFTPANVIVKTALPEPATVVKKPIVCGIDANGFLIDPELALGVWLVVGVYDVSYRITDASVPSHSIEVLVGNDDSAPIDLTTAMPPGGPILSASEYAELDARLTVVEGGGGGGGVTLEQVQDDLGVTSLVAGVSLTKTYDDGAGTITLDVDAADFDPAGSAAAAEAAAIAASATTAQGALADTATQPGDLATVATSGAYVDLSGTPTLGTAAAAATGDFDPVGSADAAEAASQPLDAVLTATTASFTTADETKLDGIEELADVTDTANVTAAGALMDSEVDADIKTLSLPAATTISTFGASLIDDAAASNARTTLGLGTAATTASTAYATAAQGTLADAALPRVAGGASVENIGAIEENVNTVAATGAAETLDISTFGVHDCTMDEACTFTFSNPAPSGKASSFVLILRGAFTPTLPASVDWSGGTAPTYATPSVYVFTTVDGGTTWVGAQSGSAFS